MRTRKSRGQLGLLAALALLGAACGGDPEAAAPEVGADAATDGAAAEPVEDGDGEAVSGAIDIDGSSTVGPLTDAVSEIYAEEQPEVTVNLGISGTGGGFERFCAGETDISNASRDIEEEEVTACEEGGVEYTEVRVGTDALTVVGHPGIDFTDCLTFEQLATIWGADEPATNWNELSPDYPDRSMEVFAPGVDSGTYDFFTEEVLGDPEEGAEQPRADYNASEDDNIIAQGVATTEGAWGYFGFAYFQENPEALKAFAVDNGESGCVEPSLETAEAGEYPLARPLFIYVNNESLSDPAVADYVSFYLDNVNDVITDVGYIPAPEEALSEAQTTVEEAISSAGG